MCRRLQGIIIYRQRQVLNWSQTTLCAGICAVSYLSKIEQGKAEGSPEILRLLLHRLGVEWQDDPAFCQETSAWFEEWYDRLFSGEQIDELKPALAQRQKELQNSPFFLDWLMLTWLTSGKAPENVEDYVAVMDDRQYNLYLCLTEQFQKLLRTSDQSYFLLEAGKRPFWRGDYARAAACFRQGMDMAYREGSLLIMMECCGNLAACYSCLNQLTQTREYYTTAIRMARSLGRAKDVAIIAYNLATTELQLGLTEDALRHLLEHPWNEAVYFQKLAICYAQIGQKEKAQAALDQMLAAPLTVLLEGTSGETDQIRDIFKQIYQLVHIRLENPNYLKDPEYGGILISCIHSMKSSLPMGFLQFYAAWLEEWYLANRQYRKAHDVLRTFFIN